MSKKWFFLLPAVALVCSVMAAAFLKTADKSFLRENEKMSLSAAENEGMPPALRKHLEKVMKTIPGNGGESDKGPGGAADQKLFAMAYPAKDIALDRLVRAREAFENIKNRSISSPRGATPWVSYGPSIAKVPFFGPRDVNVYLPNKGFAGGRTPVMAISSVCTNQSCRLWIGAAGGGIWRTDKALAKTPVWTFVSGSFLINSVGSIAVDPNDSTGNTILVGTGEANVSGDSVHGVGLYKSIDGGDTWTGPLGQSVFDGRALGSIAVKSGDSNVIYAGTVRAVHGIASVAGGGTSILVPGAAIWGLYKSTDAGATWALIHNGGVDLTNCTDPATVASNATQCSPRGVRNVRIDPSDPNTIYASSYARGVWRSLDEGGTWAQILVPLDSTNNTDRAEIAVTTLPNGNTRMYAGEGHTGAGGQYSRLFRSDDVATGSPTFTDLTGTTTADPGFGSFNYCTGQCWYDNLVYTPAGFPDMVYLGGAFQYGEEGVVSNGRGLVLSQDAGVTWTDQTNDGSDATHPNGLHPDNHSLVTNPNDPFQFIEGNDGGVWRSSGGLKNVSNFCNSRGLSGSDLTQCQALLSAVPQKIKPINKGLTTLQFQSVSVSPFDSRAVQGGTQDNGTWESKKKNSAKWLNSMIGDGGQSGHDIANNDWRFHTFFRSQVDVNFSAGAVADWNWVADQLVSEFGLDSFYIPIINDPTVSKTLFSGAQHVWRSQTYGLGSMTIAQLRQHCNEWTGDFAVPCGDFVTLGTLALTDPSFGDRPGGFITAVERTTADNSTLWAATSTGRIFVSKNVDAVPETAVVFTRIDGLSILDPGRFVSSIFVDPANANHALVTYAGFSANTPTEPGHVFDVLYDPIAGTAIFTPLDGAGLGALGDIPINDGVWDSNGDTYISTDTGVLRDDAAAGIDWQLAAPGMPNIEIAGLTIVSADRKLYAASHGQGAWLLTLP